MKIRLKRAPYAAGLVLAIWGAWSGAAAADPVADMATRLAALRAEVESLSQSLAETVAEGRDQLRSLSRQKSDLELEAQREETRIEKLRQAVAERRQAVEAEKAQASQAGPLFSRLAEQTKQYIASALPFRRADRLAEVRKLEEQVASGVLSAPKALTRLWAFLEDEHRLVRESGLYTQTLTVDGKEHLGDVVRLGMLTLYFRLGDGRVGYSERQGDDWGFVVEKDAKGQQEIEELFASFKKQVRVGYFELPAALPPGGAP